MAYLRSEGQTGVQFKEVYQGIERDSMAYKLMSSMGWQEGDGLGAQKQGINVHVKAHKKFDTKGVGMKEQAARMQDWTLDMCKFSAVLKGLKEISAPESALEPVAEQTDNTVSLKPKKADKKKKRVRDEEEAVAAAETVARTPSFTTCDSSKQQSAKHAAMYSRRKKQKIVKRYSATDIAAILGHTPEPAGAAAPVIAPITIAAAEEEAPVKKSKKMKRQSKDTSVHSQDQVVAQKPISAPSLPTESNSWWNSLFRRGDSMGAANSQGLAAAKRTAFSEQDQTALYTSAHTDKSRGRKGLGSKSAKLKASQWQGKKLRFDDDEEEHAEDEEASEGEAEKPVDVLTGNIDRDKLPGGTVVVWGGQRPQWFTALKQQQPQPDRRQRSAQAVEAPPNVSNKPTVGTGEPLSLSEKQRKKCLKVACKMLKRCEGGIKLKEVVDSALAALKVSQSVDAVTLRSKVKTVIKKGDGWSIQGGKLMAAIAVSS